MGSNIVKSLLILSLISYSLLFITNVKASSFFPIQIDNTEGQDSTVFTEINNIGLKETNTNYDFNSDGTFNIMDIIFLIKILFDGLPNPTPQPTPIANPSITPTVKPTPSDISIIKDVYNQTPPTIEVKQSFIGEVRLLSEAANILRAKNWSGNTESLGIRLSDINPQLIISIENDEIERKSAFSIPPELQQYYTSNAAQSQIMQTISQCRQEYLDYLSSKGVNPGIIQVFDQEVLLNIDESLNLVNDFVDDETVSVIKPGGRGEHDLVITISTINVWNDARILRNSQVISHMYGGTGADYEKLARDMAVRRQTYHEMTHALQEAANIHLNRVSDSHVNIAYFERAYFRAWGNPDDINNVKRIEWENEHVGFERQAEGVSTLMLSEKYNYSPQQTQNHYSMQFDRFAEVRKELDNFLDIFDEKNPNYNPTKFPDDFLESISKNGGYGGKFSTLKIVYRAIGAPAYVGYFNPLTIEEAQEFWTKLQ